MIKFLRLLTWTYSLAYILVIVLMLIIMAIANEASLILFVQSFIIMIPAIILIRHLKGMFSHFALYIVGILIALHPLVNAHAFIPMPGVTASFYILFLPMAVLLLLPRQ